MNAHKAMCPCGFRRGWADMGTAWGDFICLPVLCATGVELTLHRMGRDNCGRDSLEKCLPRCLLNVSSLSVDVCSVFAECGCDSCRTSPPPLLNVVVASVHLFVECGLARLWPCTCRMTRNCPGAG